MDPVGGSAEAAVWSVVGMLPVTAAVIVVTAEDVGPSRAPIV